MTKTNINTTNIIDPTELSDDALDAVSGGAWPILGIVGGALAIGVAAAAGKVLYDAVTEVSDAMDTSTNVVAGPDGRGCTEHGLPNL